MVDEKKVFCFWESFKKIKILDIVAKLWKKGRSGRDTPISMDEKERKSALKAVCGRYLP